MSELRGNRLNAVVIPTRAANGTTLIPGYGPYSGTNLSEVRSKLSGLHFAKECLSDGEREILSLAEALLDLLDEESPRGYRR